MRGLKKKQKRKQRKKSEEAEMNYPATCCGDLLLGLGAGYEIQMGVGAAVGIEKEKTLF